MECAGQGLPAFLPLARGLRIRGGRVPGALALGARIRNGSRLRALPLLALGRPVHRQRDRAGQGREHQAAELIPGYHQGFAGRSQGEGFGSMQSGPGGGRNTGDSGQGSILLFRQAAGLHHPGQPFAGEAFAPLGVQLRPSESHLSPLAQPVSKILSEEIGGLVVISKCT